MKPEESSSSPETPADPSAEESAPGRPVKKLAKGLLVALIVYLLSYGPAVTGAVNRYGRLQPRTKAVLSTLYAPAHWLAENSEIYNDYRLFWVKRSRNYQWWLNQRDAADAHALLPPSRLRRPEPPTSATRFQFPIPEPEPEPEPDTP